MLGREEFQLVETLLYTRQQGFFLLEQHLQRLRRSAHTLGFSCPSEQLLLQRLGQEAQHWPPESASRIRLLIDRHGMICVERAAMAAVALHPPISMNAIKASKPLEVILDSAATPAFGVFTKHKTTQRDAYTAARKRVGIASDGSGPAFDVLMFNEHGELTESSIANVAIQQPDGSWVTPKVHCGLLPGVMRAELLARNHLREQVITLSQLQCAVEAGQAICCMNSVRGVYAVDVRIPHNLPNVKAGLLKQIHCSCYSLVKLFMEKWLSSRCFGFGKN